MQWRLKGFYAQFIGGYHRLQESLLTPLSEVDKNPMGTYVLQGRQLGVLLNKLENRELYVEYLTNSPTLY